MTEGCDRLELERRWLLWYLRYQYIVMSAASAAALIVFAGARALVTTVSSMCEAAAIIEFNHYANAAMTTSSISTPDAAVVLQPQSLVKATCCRRFPRTAKRFKRWLRLANAQS